MRHYLLGVALTLSVISPASSLPSASSLQVDKLYQTSRARLALARVRGQRFFNVLIASAPGKNAQVVNAILTAGGQIVDREDDVDFIEARIPLNNVEAIASREDVTAIAADDSVTVEQPAQPSPSPKPQASPTHAPRTASEEGPLLHPYLPQRDIGLLRLRAAHPDFDGRGVVVALLDTGPDFLLPEMQHARAADGSLVPKFLDMVTGVLPQSTDDESPWIRVGTLVHAVNGTFTVRGVTYTAPHDGDFRFTLGRYDEGLVGAIARLIEPKKHFKPHDPVFGILWDTTTDTVWVDTDHDNDFSDEKGLTDYRVHHDYTTFKVPITDAQARPTLGLVIQTDVRDGKIALLPGLGSHATMTSGTIAANKDDGGLIEGIAPQAQIFSIDEGGSFASVIDSVLLAERNPRVDILCLEIISALSYSLKDGRFVESIIFERAVQRYGKPIMQPADNDFGMSRVSETCVPVLISCVGAYQNADSYRIDSGEIVPHRDNLHWVSSFGPAGNGALRPSFLSPSGWLTTGLGYVTDKGSFAAIKGVFDLPPGYGIGGGTSQATPTAAGAVALLIGAARASAFQVSPARILAAMEWTARYLPGIPAYEQGNGLYQLDAAYALLERWSREQLPKISFDAPVHTTDSQFLPVPNRGVGFFEREGWRAGESGIRVIRITRVAGAVGVERYRTELLGNDGTFAVPSSIALTLGKVTPLVLHVAPQTSGAHSAILRLRGSSGATVGETLLTVVAGEQFTAADEYTVDRYVSVPRPGTTSVFVTVPQGAQALVVRIVTPRNGINFTPYESDGMDPTNRSNNLLTAFTMANGGLQAVFRYPRPGTWELVLEDGDDLFHHAPGFIIAHPTNVRIVASIIGVDVSQRSVTRSFTVTQALASVPGLQVTHASATVVAYRGSIKLGGQHVYPITVPSGATGISATLTSSPGSSPDLYLFDCTASSCLLREKSTTLGAIHHLYYDAPKPGHWKIVVDGFTIAAGGTAYSLSTHVLGNFSGAKTVPVFSLALPGSDPYVYYNEGPSGGPQPQRNGLNPWIFDVVTP